MVSLTHFLSKTDTMIYITLMVQNLQLLQVFNAFQKLQPLQAFALPLTWENPI